MRSSSPRIAALIILCLAAEMVYCQYLETTINIPGGPLDVLWNPASNKVYTVNYDNTVTVINGATNRVITTIAVGTYPGTLYCNAVANRIYVMTGDSPGECAVEVIDGMGDTVAARIPLEGLAPGTAAFNSAMNRLYVTTEAPNTITVIDGGTDTVIRSIPVGRYAPAWLLWHPQSNRLFFYTDVDAVDTVKVLDCATDVIAVQLPLPPMQNGLGSWCYNPVNGLAYLRGTRATQAFTASGDSLAAVIPGAASSLTAVPFPNKLYLKHGWDSLWVLDCRTHTVSAAIPVHGEPMVCDSSKGKVYISAYNPDQVSVVGARADTVLTSIALPGTQPGALCWNQAESRVYIVDQMGTAVWVIRDTVTGVAETELGRGAARKCGSTFARGVFCWSGSESGSVLDAEGRIVARMRPGPNDLRSLPPGVYVVVAPGEAEHRKVVIAARN